MARGSGFTPLKVKKNNMSEVRIRQSWSKYNLYNLARATSSSYRSNTFFQMKWKAKSATRNYHGSQVREGVWSRMFDRRLRSVIPMDANYLAMNDGSIESAGRGMGADVKERKNFAPAIPYMQMTYAPLERRLDTAVFRAMFASSIRQARQFVVHGAVTVNGKKMQFPGYLLNPGDLFQVTPERVMFATGQSKESAAKVKAQKQVAEEDAAAADAAAAAQEEANAQETVEPEIDDNRDPRQVLKELQAQAKSILASPKENIGAKRKQDLRAFTKSIRQLLSKSKSGDAIQSASLETQFAEIQTQLRIRKENQQSRTAASLERTEKKALQDLDTTSETTTTPSTSASDPNTSKTDAEDEHSVTILSSSEVSELYSALQAMNENPVDETKPYATPWMPRDFMSAFAFIPRFLEVNHNICAAVYLRHPVSRPGLAEVPTPFSELTSSTAFSWYLRRR